MSHPRVFVDADAIGDKTVRVTGDSYHHLAVVLRVAPGDRFWAVVAETETEHLVEIKEIRGQALEGRITESRRPESEAEIELTLYQGLPKRSRFKMVLQKCTELGVARIVPVMTQRSVVKLSEERARRKLDRWQKICTEAARQSRRPVPAEVAAPVTFPDALAEWQASNSAGILLDEGLAGEDGPGLRQVLRSGGVEKRIALFIGPEGGFSAGEARKGTDAGLVAAGLGARILRTETAAIVVSTIVMYEAGELG